MAQYSITTANSTLQFETNTTYSAGNGSNCYLVDANHLINFWAGLDYDGYVQIFTVSTSTWAITTANSSLEFDAANATHNSCYKIDTNHFINFWAGNAADGFTQVFTVNTTTWAVTTAGATLEFDTQNCYYNYCCQIDANHFINFHAGVSGDGFVRTFTVNTTTWAITSPGSLEFDTQNDGNNSCIKVDTNHFLNVWGGGSTSANASAQIFAVNTSTWAVSTAGSILVFDTNCGSAWATYYIDATHAIVFYNSANTVAGNVVVLAINTTTWAVTTANTALNFDTRLYSATALTCSQYDANHFIAFWQEDYDGDFSPKIAITQMFTVSTSTWAVTTSAGRLNFLTNSNAFSNSCFKVDTSHFVNFWGRGQDGNGYAQIFAVEGAALGPANLKSYNTNLKANIKSINTNLIANVKSLDTNV